MIARHLGRATAIAAVLLLASPSIAQHAHHDAPEDKTSVDAHAHHGAATAPGPNMSADSGHQGQSPQADPHAGHSMQSADPAAMDHSAHQMDEQSHAESMPQMDHSMHQMHAMDHGSGTGAPEDTPGDTPAPPVPTQYAADQVYGREAMEHGREELFSHGAFTTASVKFELMEYRHHDGKDGYAIEASGFYGGDIDRLTVAIEAEGAFGETAEAVELRAAWRHAINPWFNMELGARHDIQPSPNRTYGFVGIEGLAPYWIEASGYVFVSDKGDVHLRAEAEYDQRISNRLILQPLIEVDIALQDVPELEIGSGIEKVELGARLRYAIRREFAPYVGVNWERKLGQTADFARAEGEDPSALSVVFGLRSWF